MSPTLGRQTERTPGTCPACGSPMIPTRTMRVEIEGVSKPIERVTKKACPNGCRDQHGDEAPTTP